jgi:hypothetical protein
MTSGNPVHSHSPMSTGATALYPSYNSGGNGASDFRNALMTATARPPSGGKSCCGCGSNSDTGFQPGRDTTPYDGKAPATSVEKHYDKTSGTPYYDIHTDKGNFALPVSMLRDGLFGGGSGGGHAHGPTAPGGGGSGGGHSDGATAPGGGTGYSGNGQGGAGNGHNFQPSGTGFNAPYGNGFSNPRSFGMPDGSSWTYTPPRGGTGFQSSGNGQGGVHGGGHGGVHGGGNGYGTGFSPNSGFGGFGSGFSPVNFGGGNQYNSQYNNPFSSFNNPFSMSGMGSGGHGGHTGFSGFPSYSGGSSASHGAGGHGSGTGFSPGGHSAGGHSSGGDGAGMAHGAGQAHSDIRSLGPETFTPEFMKAHARHFGGAGGTQMFDAHGLPSSPAAFQSWLQDPSAHSGNVKYGQDKITATIGVDTPLAGYRAAIDKVIADNPKLKPGSEEFYNKVGREIQNLNDANQIEAGLKQDGIDTTGITDTMLHWTGASMIDATGYTGQDAVEVKVHQASENKKFNDFAMRDVNGDGIADSVLVSRGDNGGGDPNNFNNGHNMGANSMVFWDGRSKGGPKSIDDALKIVKMTDDDNNTGVLGQGRGVIDKVVADGSYKGAKDNGGKRAGT